MERTDELKERIRQQPLNDRLEESRRRIGDMCSKGRCPKMTIPVQHDDDDFYINTTLADAQATIAALEETILKMGENAAVVAKDAMAAKEQVAALQARVQELEQWVQDQSTANLETMRHTDEMQSRALEAEQQLTQRTAELEAANKHWDALWNAACEQKDTLQAELERVRGEIAETKEVEVALSSKVAEYEIELNGDPQNFYGRGRTVGLRTLIAALPKVEEEIAVKRTEVDLSDVWGITLNGYFTFQSALFDGKEEAESYAAILKHRQGMEG